MLICQGHNWPAGQLDRRWQTQNPNKHKHKFNHPTTRPTLNNNNKRQTTNSYIAKAGTPEADGAAGASTNPLNRLSSLLRGHKAAADRISVEGVGDDAVERAALLMDGFSAREIAKFAASVQAAVYGSARPVLTPELFQRVLDYKLREHAARRAFVLGHHGTGEAPPAAAGGGAGGGGSGGGGGGGSAAA